MTECHRCGRDTDRQTLNGEPLCAKCAEWRNDHQESREADQHGLERWENEGETKLVTDHEDTENGENK